MKRKQLRRSVSFGNGGKSLMLAQGYRCRICPSRKGLSAPTFTSLRFGISLKCSPQQMMKSLLVDHFRKPTAANLRNTPDYHVEKAPAVAGSNHRMYFQFLLWGGYRHDPSNFVV